jgi:hypothetical protein
MKQRIKVPRTLQWLFLSSFSAAAMVAATGTAHAGWWRITAKTCPTYSDGTRHCPVADASKGQPSRQFLSSNIEVFDANPNDELWARHCLRWWNGPSYYCGNPDRSGVQFTGHKTLKPEVTWYINDVLHGWVAADNSHFAYVQVYDTYGGTYPPGSLKFKGIFYYW